MAGVFGFLLSHMGTFPGALALRNNSAKKRFRSRRQLRSVCQVEDITPPVLAHACSLLSISASTKKKSMLSSQLLTVKTEKQKPSSPCLEFTRLCILKIQTLGTRINL